MEERIGALDIAKGFAIMLIVFSHCAYSNSYLNIFARGFQLPMFFVISGIIYGVTGRKVTVGNKIAKFIALYIVIELLMMVGTNRLFERDAIIDFVSFKGNSPVWYLVCFLLVLLLFSVIEKACPTRDLAIMLYVLIGMLGLFLPYRQPVALYRSCIGLIFFVAGYFLHDIFLKRRSWVLISLEFVMFLMFTWKNGYVDLWNMVVSNQLLYFFNAFLGMHICIQVSYALESSIKLEKLKKLIATCGQHSLFILCTHWVIIGIAYAVESVMFGETYFDIASRIICEVHGTARTIFVLVLDYAVLRGYMAFPKKKNESTMASIQVECLAQGETEVIGSVVVDIDDNEADASSVGEKCKDEGICLGN